MGTRFPLPHRFNVLVLVALTGCMSACGSDFVAAVDDIPSEPHHQCPTGTALPKEVDNLPPQFTLDRLETQSSETLPPGSLEPAPEATELRDLLESLEVVEPAGGLPTYNRSHWGSWRDEDSDCQNAREETLIVEAIGDVSFHDSSNECKVASGEWHTPFSEKIITDPSELDIDHMVPLKNAHLSGAWAWTAETRKAYFNDLSYANHLIAVTASANRSKGARGPESWKPENESYWCEYATDWIVIKLDWSLSANADEWNALEEVIETCP